MFSVLLGCFLNSWTDGNVCALVTRNGTGDENDVVFRANLNNLEVLDSAIVNTVTTGHLFVFPDTARPCASTYTTRTTVHLVVEATGIRDVPSDPLLRISHDRFVPGLHELVENVKQRSVGRTKLLASILFLALAEL